MSYRIGLWGPSGAGKTALLYQLCTHIPKRTGWRIFPNEAARSFLAAAAAETAQNRFPPATAVGTRTNVAYDLITPAGTPVTIALTDRAGEEIEMLTDEITRELNDNDALVLLFDVMQDRQDLRHALHRVLNSLHMSAGHGAGMNPTPVAICLTKVDRLLLTHRDLQEAEQPDPAGFIRNHIDLGLEEIAKARLARFRFFPLSAAGVFVDNGLIRAATFYDETLTLRLAAGGLPVNLTAPIEWLLEQDKDGRA
jgi:hypothetical protein